MLMLVGVAGEPFSAAAQAAFALVSTRSSCLTSERVPAIVAGQEPCCESVRAGARRPVRPTALLSGGADAGVVPTSTSGRSSPRAAVARWLRDHLANGCASRCDWQWTRQPHASDVAAKVVMAMRARRRVFRREGTVCNATQNTVCEFWDAVDRGPEAVVSTSASRRAT